MQTPPASRLAAAAIITASLLPASALGAAVAGGPEPTAIPTARGLERFIITAPESARSRASRVNADHADKTGRIPADTAGYEVASTVIVRTHGGAGAPPRAEGVAQARPVPGLPGYWTLSAATVRDAATLALALRSDPAVAEAYLDVRTPQPLRTPPTDPGYAFQWHLNNTQPPLHDLNVEPVWKQVSGAGVTVGVIEDGWNTSHPDLVANYHSEASQGGTNFTSHGTSVAGLVAASSGNGIGGVGVAPGARVSRLYRGSAMANADAFLFRTDLNFIKTNSWGPADNGVLGVITPLEIAALAQAAGSGRDGLGTVHIWAAGNGGNAQDRVDYDPYASSRYTIAVGALDDDDERAYYNETGSSMFVVAPSSGDFSGDRGIYTTTGTSFYTASFGGTSAAAPMIAGVVALMLEARPDLSWRDVKHILARTARRCDPADPGWQLNAGGRWISYDYGFGAADAEAAVALAQSWATAGPETAATSGVLPVNASIPNNEPAGISRTVTIADDLRVESVEVRLTVAHPYIGDLRIILTAPSGTQSILALPRSDATDNYAGYVFTTARHWDERSAGQWTLRISDEGLFDAGVWTDWTLTVYGPPPCAADFSGDHIVNSTDISAFLTAWIVSINSGTLVADFNSDGAVNSTDVSAFLTAWLAETGAGLC